MRAGMCPEHDVDPAEAADRAQGEQWERQREERHRHRAWSATGRDRAPSRTCRPTPRQPSTAGKHARLDDREPVAEAAAGPRRRHAAGRPVCLGSSLGLADVEVAELARWRRRSHCGEARVVVDRTSSVGADGVPRTGGERCAGRARGSATMGRQVVYRAAGTHGQPGCRVAGLAEPAAGVEQRPVEAAGARPRATVELGNSSGSHFVGSIR